MKLIDLHIKHLLWHRTETPVFNSIHDIVYPQVANIISMPLFISGPTSVVNQIYRYFDEFSVRLLTAYIKAL
jgi:hypothetical protein